MATRRRCRGAPVRMRPLLLPLSSVVCYLLGFWRCSRHGGCWHFIGEGCQSGQSQGLWVFTELLGCWAAALAVGDAVFVGGARFLGAVRQPWPRGWHGW